MIREIHLVIVFLFFCVACERPLCNELYSYGSQVRFVEFYERCLETENCRVTLSESFVYDTDKQKIAACHRKLGL